MKHFKRFISLLLAFVLSATISVSAFAAETESTIPEVEKHTIEITLEPGESIDTESSITPNMRRTNDPIVNYTIGNVYYSRQFTATSQNLRYEVIVVDENLQPCNISVMVSLITTSYSPVTKKSVNADGSTNFLGASVTPNSNYMFKIENDSSTRLHVTIYYYCS